MRTLYHDHRLVLVAILILSVITALGFAGSRLSINCFYQYDPTCLAANTYYGYAFSIASFTADALAISLMVLFELRGVHLRKVRGRLKAYHI